MFYNTPEDYYKSNARLSPLYYQCGECGKEFEQDPGNCHDVCGGRVRGVYREDLEKNEERECL